MGTFSSLNIGSQSLYLNQLALEVTGHNIANVNTEGYTRQRVDQKTGVPTNTGIGQIGTGALLHQIVRITDDFVANQVAKESQMLMQRQREDDILSRIEQIFNEPADNNLSNLLGQFFDSLNTLSTNPEDTSIRAMVKENGNLVAEMLNSMYTQLEDIKDRTDEQISLRIGDVNSLTGQIATLNDNIARAEVGGMYQANDYRDARDKLVRQLQDIMDISVVPDGTNSNTISITIRGVSLVQRDQSYDLEAYLDGDNHYQIRSEASGDNIDIRGGELYGYLDGRDTVVTSYQDRIDTLASAIIESVNRVHSRGVGLTGYGTVTSENGTDLPATTKLNNIGYSFTPKDGSFFIAVYDRDKNLIEQQEITVSAAADSLEDIRARIDAMTNITATIDTDGKLTIEADGVNSGMNFAFTSADGEGDSSDLLLSLGINTFFSGSSASDMDVSTVIENDLNKITAAKRFAPGDNSNAIDMVNLRATLSMNNNTNSFDDYYGAIVGFAGIEAQEAGQRYSTSQGIVQLLSQRWQESVGVSLDEEVINMIRYQRAYQASAKFIQAVDSMLSQLFNSI